MNSTTDTVRFPITRERERERERYDVENDNVAD